MSKINKLGQSTFVIAILSFLLVAVLAFGGTYAFFSAKVDASSDTMTMGSLAIDLTGIGAAESREIFVEGVAHPNQYIIGSSTAGKTVGVDLTTTINAFVRVKVAITVLDSEGNDTLFTEAITEQDGLTEDEVVVFTDDVAGWKYHSGYFYLSADGTNAEATMEDETLTLQAYVAKEVGANYSKALMGAQIKIEIAAEAVQAEYLNGGDAANKTTTISIAELHTNWKDIVDSVYPAG